jgi:uncharacterized protein YndB with AHSA1/START domain
MRARRLAVRGLAVLAVLLAALAAVVAMQPAEFRVARTATMAAAPATVFAEVHDFRRWQAWNPWATLDPAMTHRYEGAPAGPGAVYAWAGNGEVGEGRMTLTESRPPELIRIRLEFLEPFPGTSTAEFTFRPEGDGTAVTWSMSGTNNFVARAIHLVVDMDRMIGGQFDRGLARMKAVVEAAPRR